MAKHSYTVESLYELVPFRCNKQINVRCPEHINLEMEIVLVFEGTLRMNIRGKDYVIPAGSGVFVLPFETHDFFTQGESVCYVLMASDKYAKEFFKTVSAAYPTSRLFSPGEGLLGYLLAMFETYKGCVEQETAVHAMLYPLYHCIGKQCAFEKKEVFSDTFLMGLVYINDHFTEDITERDIAGAVGMHPFSFSRLFSEKAGMNIRKYINIRRLSYVAEKLTKDRDVPISAVAYEAGFSSIRNFNRFFKDEVGCSPKEFRANLKE